MKIEPYSNPYSPLITRPHTGPGAPENAFVHCLSLSLSLSFYLNLILLIFIYTLKLKLRVGRGSNE